MNPWDIPELREDRLFDRMPTDVYAGGLVQDPARTLFVWRTCRFPAEARGGILGFYTDDYRFACLWKSP